VLHHQIEETRQVRHRNEDEVRREPEERLRDEGHEFPVEEMAKARRTGVVGEIERGAEGEQWCRHHDQQEVLDHVVTEVLHIEHANDGLRREERDDQSRQEGNGSLGGPSAHALCANM